MDAIITAGGIPLPGEPLYEYTQGKPKALLNIAGKPMIQWVLDALSLSPRINHIVIVGLPELGGVTCTKPTSFIASQKDMLSNIQAGLQMLRKFEPVSEYALIAASDVPGITPQMVDWLVEQIDNSNADVCYQVISKQVMEKKYPGSRRTYLHLKNLEVCGGDINAVRINTSLKLAKIWEKLIDSRKNPIRQASILGFDVLLGLLFHTDTLDVLARKISKHMEINGKAILCPFAEVGMDIDKPHQLEIMRSDLAGRLVP